MGNLLGIRRVKTQPTTKKVIKAIDLTAVDEKNEPPNYTRAQETRLNIGTVIALTIMILPVVGRQIGRY